MRGIVYATGSDDLARSPCGAVCDHKRCTALREDAAARCGICLQPIGYGREFVAEGRRPHMVYRHVACEKQEREDERVFDSYVPAGLEQRPPLDIAAPKLHAMLRRAMVDGYVSGSVGCTQEETGEASHWKLEVSYKIVRKKPRKKEAASR